MDNVQEELLGKAGGKEQEGSAGNGRPGGWRKAGRFAFRLLLVGGGLFLLLIVGLMLMSSFTLEGMEGFRRHMERADEVLIYFRLAVIGLLIGFWRPLNVWLARFRQWPEGQLERVLAGRWWALGMLLFIELVLVQRIHEPLIAMVK